MKCKFINSKIFRIKNISIFSFIAFSVFAMLFMQNCSYGSRGKRNRIPTEKLSLPYKGKSWGPRMRYIEGGSLAVINGLGSPYRIDISKTGDITVTSFLVAEFPTTNRLYFIYVDDLKRERKIKQYKAALPDVNVWKKEFTANDNLRNYPFAKIFLDYPAVGLNYEQCVNYCKWLTEKEESLRNPKKKVVKEKSKIKSDAEVAKEKAKEAAPVEPAPKSDAEIAEANAKEAAPVEPTPKSDAEIAEAKGEDEGNQEEEEDLEPIDLEAMEAQYIDYVERATGEAKYVYRIPTEAELIFAAKATQATQKISKTEKGYEEVVETTRIGDYGSGDSNVRITGGKPENIGKFVGLFKINRGNYKGIPGENDTNAPTENVYTRDPNGLGLRGMYGNINVWTSDFYRQDSASVIYSDYNPARSDDLYDNEYDKNSPLSEPCMVIFGGSWDTTPEEIRSFMNAKSSSNTVGFRIVASVA